MKAFTRTAKFVYSCFSGLAVFMILCISSCKEATAIKCDGVYQHREGSESYYLRFYDDGSVITVTSSGTSKQIAKWFDKSLKDVSNGHYTLTGTHIKFSSTDSHGTVDYEGDIQNDQIELKTFSHINSFTGNQVYMFIEN